MKKLLIKFGQEVAELNGAKLSTINKIKEYNKKHPMWVVTASDADKVLYAAAMKLAA